MLDKSRCSWSPNKLQSKFGQGFAIHEFNKKIGRSCVQVFIGIPLLLSIIDQFATILFLRSVNSSFARLLPALYSWIFLNSCPSHSPVHHSARVLRLNSYVPVLHLLPLCASVLIYYPVLSLIFLVLFAFVFNVLPVESESSSSSSSPLNRTIRRLDYTESPVHYRVVHKAV